MNILFTHCEPGRWQAPRYDVFFRFLMSELTGGGTWEPQRFLGNLKETIANLVEDWGYPLGHPPHLLRIPDLHYANLQVTKSLPNADSNHITDHRFTTKVSPFFGHKNLMSCHIILLHAKIETIPKNGAKPWKSMVLEDAFPFKGMPSFQVRIPIGHLGKTKRWQRKDNGCWRSISS